jgi:ABC-type glutathione transport system ATPase component
MLGELLRLHDLVPAARLAERCRELMALVHLPDRVLSAKPRELSGGERQRVAIARALALEPAVLIADEAVSALDTSVQAAIINLLAEVRERLGLTVLFISHDLAVIKAVCESVVVMNAGTIVEQGPVDQVFTRPAHSHTRELLDALPRLDLSNGPAERFPG